MGLEHTLRDAEREREGEEEEEKRELESLILQDTDIVDF